MTFVLKYMKELQKNHSTLFGSCSNSLKLNLTNHSTDKTPLNIRPILNKLFELRGANAPKFIMSLAPHRHAFLMTKHPVLPVEKLIQEKLVHLKAIANSDQNLRRYARAMITFACREILDDHGQLHPELVELLGLQDAMAQLENDEDKNIVRDGFVTAFVTEFLYGNLEIIYKENPTYNNDIFSLISGRQLTIAIVNKLQSQFNDASPSTPEGKAKKYLLKLIADNVKEAELKKIIQLPAGEIPQALTTLILTEKSIVEATTADSDDEEQKPQGLFGRLSASMAASKAKTEAAKKPAAELLKKILTEAIHEVADVQRNLAKMNADSFVKETFNFAVPSIMAEVLEDFTANGKPLVQDFNNVDFLEYLFNEPEGAKKIFDNAPVFLPTPKKKSVLTTSTLNFLKELGEKPEVKEEILPKFPCAQEDLSRLNGYFHQLILQSGKIVAPATIDVKDFVQKLVFLSYAEILDENSNVKTDIANIFPGMAKEKILGAYIRKILITIASHWLVNTKAQQALKRQSISPDILTTVINAIQNALKQGLSLGLLKSLKGFPVFGDATRAEKFTISIPIETITDIISGAKNKFELIDKTCADINKFIIDRRDVRIKALKEKAEKAEAAINACSLILKKADEIGEAKTVIGEMYKKHRTYQLHLVNVYDSISSLEFIKESLESDKMALTSDNVALELYKIAMYTGAPTTNVKTPIAIGVEIARELGLITQQGITVPESKDSDVETYFNTVGKSSASAPATALIPALDEMEKFLTELATTINTIKVPPQPANNPFNDEEIAEEKDDGEGWLAVNPDKVKLIPGAVEPSNESTADASERDAMEAMLANLNKFFDTVSKDLDGVLNGLEPTQLAAKPAQIKAQIKSGLVNHTKTQNEFLQDELNQKTQKSAIDQKITEADKLLDEIINTADQWKANEKSIDNIKKIREATKEYLLEISGNIQEKIAISKQHRQFYLPRKNIITAARLKDFVWDDMSTQAAKIEMVRDNMAAQIGTLNEAMGIVTQTKISELSPADVTSFETMISKFKVELETNKAVLYKTADAIITRVGPVQTEFNDANRKLEEIYSKVVYLLLGNNVFWRRQIGFFGGGTKFVACDNKEYPFPKRAVAMMTVAKQQIKSKDTADLKLIDIAKAFENTPAGWGIGRSHKNSKFHSEISKPLLALTKNNLYNMDALNKYNEQIDAFMKWCEPQDEIRKGYLEYATTSPKIHAAAAVSMYSRFAAGDKEEITIFESGSNNSSASENGRRNSVSSAPTSTYRGFNFHS
jgi:hypothetical protein